MNMEKLFSITVGDYTKAMSGTVFDYVQNRIEMWNYPVSTREYLLDRLFLQWMSLQKDMIISLLNTASVVLSYVGDNDGSES